MLRFLTGCAAIAMVASPVWAQSTPPGQAGQVTVPSGQNSGAGIPARPGTESGPVAKPGAGGNTSSQGNEAVRQQDSAKIPGLPGNKSGPAVSPPAGSAASRDSSKDGSSQAGSHSIAQKLSQDLQQAGFTDIKIMPDSFLVRAKDRDGNPVMMVVNPDSIIAIERQPAGSTSGQGTQMR
jgi:hypothetical protein